MRILLDTNILLDYILLREPFAKDAKEIVNYCKQELLEGAISTQSIADMFYILRKELSVEDRREILLSFCEIFHVETIGKDKIIRALINQNFSDFEDCLQMECALSFKADYIITRNVSDYVASKIPCLTSRDFCEIFRPDEQED